MKSAIKNKLFDAIVESINIGPELQYNANKKVNGIVKHIENSFNNSAQVYFQGSNRLGTVVKPYCLDRSLDYDYDLVVQFKDDKNKTKPEEIKIRLGNLLKKSIYGESLEESRRCWCLIFSEKYGSNYHIDLLPSVSESKDEKEKIVPATYLDTAIAITNIKNKDVVPYSYDWRASNPNGYAEWFLNVNNFRYSKYIERSREVLKQKNPKLYENLTNEGIEFTRTPLQKVIQILKRHRDVMYANNSNKEYKPISIIITTLVGKIVEENELVQNNTYDLLNEVLNGLLFYSELCTEGITSDFDERFKNKQLIAKNISKDGSIYWGIKNPANSKENLADKWCKENIYAVEFFRWVKQVKEDLINILDLSANDILLSIKHCLGEDVYKDLLGFDFIQEETPKEFVVNSLSARPYKCYE